MGLHQPLLWAVVLLVTSGAAAQSSSTAPTAYHEAARHDLSALIGAPVGWTLSIHDPDRLFDDENLEHGNTSYRCLHVPGRPALCDPLTFHTDHGSDAQMEVAVAADRLMVAGQWRPVLRLTSRSLPDEFGWRFATRFLIPEPHEQKLRELAGFILSDLGGYTVLKEGPLAGTVVTADAMWLPPEAHYGKHHFRITLRVVTDFWSQPLFSYVTPDMYDPVEEPAKFELLLERERPMLMEIFGRLYTRSPMLLKALGLSPSPSGHAHP